MLCHCDSQQPFALCCQPHLEGTLRPATPLALMRSRYSAFVLGLGEYLLASWHPDTQGQLTADELTAVGRETEWLSLTIIFAAGTILEQTATEKTVPEQVATEPPRTGQIGTVEFKARYRESGRVSTLHERSNFELHEGRWLYRDGIINPPKISANQPCPCGATKAGKTIKYKHCCAKRTY